MTHRAFTASTGTDVIIRTKCTVRSGDTWAGRLNQGIICTVTSRGTKCALGYVVIPHSVTERAVGTASRDDRLLWAVVTGRADVCLIGGQADVRTEIALHTI